MAKLKKMKSLNKMVRQDDVAEMGKSTWELVREALKAGKTDEALEFLSYGCDEVKGPHDWLVSVIDMALTQLSQYNEGDVEKLFKDVCSPQVQSWIKATPGAEESLYRSLSAQRGHFANYTVTEEPDRYVVKYDPCGTMGRLRRTRSVGTTKNKYPWAWSKTGIPYYCTHCCIGWEVLPIELRGFPIRITVPGDEPGAPCFHLFYKKPELIPDEFFAAVGKTKTIK